MRVLLVDELDKSRTEITRMLKSLGFSVSTRETCLDGLELFQRRPSRFAVVVTEARTSGRLDGYELCEHVQQTGKLRPVIVTGYVSNGRHFSRTAKARRFLVKPFTRYELKRALRDLLEVTETGS